MIQNLQCLRAIAALLVVFVHIPGILAVIGLREFGGGGVDLFFVISGFVMVHATRTKPPSAGAFLRNRLARIMPLYWTMTIFTFAVSVIWPGVIREIGDYTSANLAMSLLFIPYSKMNGSMQPVLFVGWTLNYEIFFYMLFTIGLLMRSYAQSIAVIILTLFCLAASRVLVTPQGPILAYYTDPIVLEFGFGMGVALAMDRILVYRRFMQPLAVLLLAPSFAAVVLFPLHWPEIPSVITTGLPATVLVASAVAIDHWGWSLHSKLLLAIGDASYALYLSHPYISGAAETLRSHLHLTGIPAVLIILFILPTTVFVALLLHRVVERRLARAARHLLGTRRLPVREQSI